MTSSRGFTLIELLVVISIVALMSSVIFAALSTARAKSRDSTRKATLKQLQKAVEYYYDQNGSYPTTNGEWYTSDATDVSFNNNGGNWIPGLVPTYMTALPRDPKGGNSSIALCISGGYKSAYIYRSDGTNYILLAHCSPEGTWATNDPFYDPNRPAHAFRICYGVGCTW